MNSMPKMTETSKDGENEDFSQNCSTTFEKFHDTFSQFPNKINNINKF